MSPYRLVIFDCDGVLVDSERLAVRTETEILNSLGWPITQAEVIERFVGRSAEYMHGQIEETLGRPVDWQEEFEARYREVFERELQPVDGIAELLSTIDIPSCVASSGTHDKIRFSLSLTGLLPAFEGRIFSVQDVERGKPAPDLFLHAAAEMGATPTDCVVIEDSRSGVEAGLAAGMGVLAFAGSVTSADRLAAEGVVVFERMSELSLLLNTDR